MVESSSIVIASSIPVLQPLMQEIYRCTIPGRRLKTLKRSYDAVVDFCGRKMATAIQRRIGDANNLVDLSEIGEDVEAGNGHQNGSALARECPAPHSVQVGGSKTATSVIEGK